MLMVVGTCSLSGANHGVHAQLPCCGCTAKAGSFFSSLWPVFWHRDGSPLGCLEECAKTQPAMACARLGDLMWAILPGFYPVVICLQQSVH